MDHLIFSEIQTTICILRRLCQTERIHCPGLVRAKTVMFVELREHRLHTVSVSEYETYRRPAPRCQKEQTGLGLNNCVNCPVQNSTPNSKMTPAGIAHSIRGSEKKLSKNCLPIRPLYTIVWVHSFSRIVTGRSAGGQIQLWTVVTCVFRVWGWVRGGEACVRGREEGWTNRLLLPTNLLQTERLASPIS